MCRGGGFSKGMSTAFFEVSSYNFGLHTDSVELSPCGKQALVGFYELDEASLVSAMYGKLVMYQD